MGEIGRPPRPHVGGVEWRYLRRGVVVHALRRYGFGIQEVAECGIAPALLDDWRGTGSQGEYELAERLPACRRCLRRVAPSKLQQLPNPKE